MTDIELKSWVFSILFVSVVGVILQFVLADDSVSSIVIKIYHVFVILVFIAPLSNLKTLDEVVVPVPDFSGEHIFYENEEMISAYLKQETENRIRQDLASILMQFDIDEYTIETDLDIQSGNCIHIKCIIIDLSEKPENFQQLEEAIREYCQNCVISYGTVVD